MNVSQANEFSHFGIQVRELERSLEFYVGQLGLEVVSRDLWDEDVVGEMVGHPGASMNRAILRMPGTRSYLEIAEYVGTQGVPVDPTQANPGTCHICWYVDDLEATWSKLVEFGTQPVSEAIIDVPTGPMEGGKVIYCMDPDGIRVEFLEGETMLDMGTRDPSLRVSGQDANEFSHVGIHVRNLDTAMRFYRDELGLEVVAEWLIQEDYVRRVVGYPDADLNMAVLRLPGTQAFLEVIEYQKVPKAPVDTDTANPGTCHISFYVDDLDAAWVKLEPSGSQLVSTGKVELRTGPLSGAREIYCTDPDGVRVEILETLAYFDGGRRLGQAVEAPAV